MSRTNCNPVNVQDVPAGVVSTGPGQRYQSVFDVVRSAPGYGRRRRRQDKYNKVVAVLTNESLSRDECGYPLSDNEIARLCGVHHVTVGRIRKKLFPEQKRATNRVVKRGNSVYVQDTTNIRRGNRQRHRPSRKSPAKIHFECPEDPALAVQALVDLMGRDYVKRFYQSLQDFFYQKGILPMISDNSTTTKPHVVLMQVTPTMADNWLTNANNSNRKVSDAHVARLARDMKEGLWGVSHEAIAFDSNGVLLDGQHRLWAIIEADVTIAMHVWFNLSPKTKRTIDTGQPRSVVDVLRLNGENGDVKANEVAVLRAMLGGYRNPVKLTVQETACALARHREAIRFAMRHLPNVKAKGLCNAITRAVLARAFYGTHHQQLASFGSMITSGIILDAPSAPAVAALRQYLLTNKGRSYAERQERYGKTERALMAYLYNEPITKLISTNREHFPLPEEMETKK